MTEDISPIYFPSFTAAKEERRKKNRKNKRKRREERREERKEKREERRERRGEDTSVPSSFNRSDIREWHWRIRL